MDNIIVYVDDAEHALHQLAPMMGQPHSPVQWILVACPPRMTRHINKWVHHAARVQWRQKWTHKLFANLLPRLDFGDSRVVRAVAQGPLVDMTRELQIQYGAARVLDTRRPKFGYDMTPVTADQPGEHESRWAIPGAVAGMGAFLVLASE
jgi:hypothetical protein